MKNGSTYEKNICVCSSWGDLDIILSTLSLTDFDLGRMFAIMFQNNFITLDSIQETVEMFFWKQAHRRIPAPFYIF